jgi:hypothetical protein
MAIDNANRRLEITGNYAIKGAGAFLENSGSGSLDFVLDKGCIWKPGKALVQSNTT